jgi:sulfur carrier protein
MPQVLVNGQLKSLPADATIADLLRQLEVPARQVAVEVNQELVPRTEHAERRLADGDQLEIVGFVGGG